MAKVTMQDIADSLGVSRITVWKVFNNQPGVSNSLKETVFAKARELGYIKNNVETFSSVEEKTVSLIVSRPNSSIFWTEIIHCIAQELSKHNVSLLYTYVPATCAEGVFLPANLMNGSVHGAIAINIYDADMIKMISNLSMPKVFLDTVPLIPISDLNGDLMLIEGYNSMMQITESVVKNGNTRIGFIGDIHYAKTNLDRYNGYCGAMHKHNLTIYEKFCLTRSLSIYNYYAELKEYLDSLEDFPDAFICVNDDIAHYFHLYFAEHRDKVPKGITITGFDGNREFANIDGVITTADVKIPYIGKRLANQILYRMDNELSPTELIYLSPQIIESNTVFYKKS